MVLSRFSIHRAASKHWHGFFVLSGILLASVAIPPFHTEYFGLCLVKDAFGFACPGCGLTRALLYLGHGDIRSALALNANSLLVFSLLTLLWLHAVYNVTTQNEIKFRFTRLESFFLILLAAVATASGWIYNLQRNPWV